MVKKNTNYRKFYAEYYGIKWDSRKYEVHHIDGNHENNNIANLILLPKSLHQKIHTAITNFTPNPDISFKEQVQEYMTDILNGWSNWDIAVSLMGLIDVMNECSRWGLYKRVGYLNCDGTPMEEFND